MRNLLALLLTATLSLLGCAQAVAEPGGPMPDTLTLTGTVVHRERIALPPDAAMTVTLEDVSLADAPAVTLAQTTTALNGRQVPLPFSLTYPSAAVKPGAVYALRARITQGDTLLFTTTDRNQVDPLDPQPVELLVSQVPAANPPPAAPDATLTETYWKLTEVQGRPVVVTDGAPEPSLVLHTQDNRVSGSGGVNRVMGGYTLNGGSLTFTQMASTMMAGPPEAMQQEQAILTALQGVRGFAIAGDTLTLLDASGAPVLKAVAVALG